MRDLRDMYATIPCGMQRFIRDNKLRVSKIVTRPDSVGRTVFSFNILRTTESGKTKQFSVIDLGLPLSKLDVTDNMLIAQALPFYSYFASEYGNDDHTNAVDIENADKDTLHQYHEAQRIKRFLEPDQYEYLKYIDTEIEDSDLPEYTTIDKLSIINDNYIHIVDEQDREYLVEQGYISRKDLENFGSFFQINGNAEVKAIYGADRRFMVPQKAHCELLYWNC